MMLSGVRAWQHGVGKGRQCQWLRGLSNKVWSQGVGCNGALGHGNTDDLEVPRMIQTEALEGLNPVDIATSWTHSAVLCEGGELIGFGRTHDIDLGIRVGRGAANLPILLQFYNLMGATKSIDLIKPKLITKDKIKKVRLGGGTTGFLNDQGELTIVGYNRYGQCGIGSREVFIWDLMPADGFPTQEKVVDFALGFRHCAAVTDTGALYTWGKGERGQLGLGSSDLVDMLRPEKNDYIKAKIKKVTAGFAHTCALTEDGQVYIWGKFQGRHIKNDKKHYTDAVFPRLVEFEKDVTVLDIWTGTHHNVALVRESDQKLALYQWGMLSDKSSGASPAVNRQIQENAQKAGVIAGKLVERSALRILPKPVRVATPEFLREASEPMEGLHIDAGFDVTVICAPGLRAPLVWDWALEPIGLDIYYPELTDFLSKHDLLQVATGWMHGLFLTK
mmetsp:Transcript_19761/g.32467  ORF Transcript_19761/g.32467 Transcript_19761/m.32467 type:complete len:447 (+) Transcript_19761:75-1415(+)